AIAGTYGAVATLVLHGWPRFVVLGLVLGGSVAGIAIGQLWLDAPKRVVALPYLVVGWSALAVLPQLWRGLGGTGFILVIVGGLFYTVGALVYARRRPDPWPKVFGYHEVFHALVIGAAALHFAVIAFAVLPRG
ncbi:MAG TPA: hemolysin III family protein, partial [Solirubrobacteraceae bacterium]|nr:hemolysin III family protein [Solirubrobacteraceae bacterium]